MKLIITIDTEEDNWGSYSATDYTLANIEQIPSLQELFNNYKIVPTYLISYPVAADRKSISILKTILEKNQCEIGAHCHPWNTPPYEEEINEKNSMMCNLPEELQFRKLECLHTAIVKNFNVRPISFRAGRWGYGKETAVSIEKLGYKVDTSVSPFTDWSWENGPDFSEVSLEPYYFNPKEILKPDSEGRILEVPATIGFTQKNFKRSNNFFNFLKNYPFNRFRIIGLLDKLGLLNKVRLSPENCSSKEMIALTNRLMQNNIPLINLFFHSTSLQPGLSPFVRTISDQQEFNKRIEGFLKFTKEVGIESIKLSEAMKEV